MEGYQTGSKRDEPDAERRSGGMEPDGRNTGR